MRKGTTEGSESMSKPRGTSRRQNGNWLSPTLVSLAQLVTTVLLSVLTIAVSLAANGIYNSQLAVAKRQNELTEKQTEIQEHSAEPLWHVVAMKCQDETFDCIEIWNEEAPVDLGHIACHSYISLGMEHDTKDIPTLYFDVHNTGATHGKVAELRALRSLPIGPGPVNVTERWQLLKGQLRAAGASSAKIRTFVIIPYSTRLQQSGTAYFEVDSSLISRDEKVFGRRLTAAERLVIKPETPLVDLLTEGADHIIAAWKSKPRRALSAAPGSMLNADEWIGAMNEANQQPR